MEEKIVSRRKPTSIRNIRVSDSGEWKFSSGSEDEGDTESGGGSSTTASTTNNNNNTNNNTAKLRQLENQTVKGIQDLMTGGNSGNDRQSDLSILKDAMENKQTNNSEVKK